MCSLSAEVSDKLALREEGGGVAGSMGRMLCMFA